MSNVSTLDVRNTTPSRRHALILSTYAGLRPGESFVLVNDHDPRPLYYWFAASHQRTFSWDCLQEGPRTWHIRIGRPRPFAEED